jgi:hypothetical protein
MTIIGLPHFSAVYNERVDAADVVSLIGNGMNEAACALKECALSTRGTMAAAVTNHLIETTTADIPNFDASISGMALLRRYLAQDLGALVWGLVNNEEPKHF